MNEFAEVVEVAEMPSQQMMPDKKTLEKTLAVLKEQIKNYFIYPIPDYLNKMQNTLADFYRVEQFPSNDIEMNEIFNTINKINDRIKDPTKPALLREIFLDVRKILSEADTAKRIRAENRINNDPDAPTTTSEDTLKVFDVTYLGLEKEDPYSTKIKMGVNHQKITGKMKEFANELELLIPKTKGMDQQTKIVDKTPFPQGKIGAKIDSILYNAFQVMFNSFDIPFLKKIPLSKKNILTLYKIALLDTEDKYTKLPPTRRGDSGETVKMNVLADKPEMMFTNENENDILSKLLRVDYRNLSELIEKILHRNYVITPGDICRDTKEVKCPEGSFSEINLLKTLEAIGENSHGFYLMDKRKQIIEIVDFIKKNPKAPVTNPELKKDLFVIEYILRKGNTSTSNKSDKKNWQIPDGMFSPLLQAINLEKNVWPSDLPAINETKIIQERKKNSGAWFGGKTKKRRNAKGRKTRKTRKSRRTRKSRKSRRTKSRRTKSRRKH